MLIQPYQLLLRCALFCLPFLCLFACVGDNYREQSDKEQRSGKKAKAMYKDLDLKLASTQGAWKGNSNFKAQASIRSMKLLFNLDMNAFRESMLPVSENKADTFSQTILQMEVLFNGRPILFDIQDPDKGWLPKTSVDKLPGQHMDFKSGLFSLTGPKSVQLDIPLFVLAGCKAGSKGILSVHVWQDVFISSDKQFIEKAAHGEEITTWYNDTLKKKLIDNNYLFSFTVPQIYRTDILCDSIVLQNDAKWSPGGSDNTLWKSTYPDIYFSLSDLYEQPQVSSVTQKSTDRFDGDTLSFYHYSPSEPFSITVYDYDVLSKDDMLGYWNGDLAAFKNNASYSLRFGHVRPFYFRKREYGQVNR